METTPEASVDDDASASYGSHLKRREVRCEAASIIAHIQMSLARLLDAAHQKATLQSIWENLVTTETLPMLKRDFVEVCAREEILSGLVQSL